MKRRQALVLDTLYHHVCFFITLCIFGSHPTSEKEFQKQFVFGNISNKFVLLSNNQEENQPRIYCLGNITTIACSPQANVQLPSTDLRWKKKKLLQLRWMLLFSWQQASFFLKKKQIKTIIVPSVGLLLGNKLSNWLRCCCCGEVSPSGQGISSGGVAVAAYLYCRASCCRWIPPSLRAKTSNLIEKEWS